MRSDRRTRRTRRSLYNGTATLRLSAPRRAAAALIVALGSGGCSYQLDSMFSKPDAGVEQTGSIARPRPDAAGGAHFAAAANELSQADLDYARAAASEALARGVNGNSLPWRNPQTGVGGNITPLAASHSEDGVPCRDFLASYMSAGAQAWLQGSACRTASGEWQVKTLKPLKSG
jgi:surface antigen